MSIDHRQRGAVLARVLVVRVRFGNPRLKRGAVAEETSSAKANSAISEVRDQIRAARADWAYHQYWASAYQRLPAIEVGTDEAGTLTLADGDGSVANLNLLFSYATSLTSGDPAAHFAIASDGQGGTLVTTDLVKPAA